MRAIKRTVSVLLTLMLVLGMVTIAIGTASAAETTKIRVTSNIGVSTSKVYNASTETVTITFNIKAANLIGTRGLITYDQNVLELADTTATKIFPNLTAGLVANTTKTDGRIPFSAYSLNGFEFDTAKVYVKLTFNVKNCTKDTTVNLDILDLIGSSTIPNKDETDEINYIHNGTIVDSTAYTASVEETVSPMIDPGIFISDVRLNLAGKIGFNFYFNMNPTGYKNVTFKFEGPEDNESQNVTISLNQLQKQKRNGVVYYYYTYFMYAHMMTQEMTINIYADGNYVTSEVYTVENWALDHMDEFQAANPDQATLLKTMLNYGAATQTQFDLYTDKLANRTVKDHPLERISASKITVPSGMNVVPDLTSIGATFTKMNAELKDGTAIRLTITATDRTKFNKNKDIIQDGTVIPYIDENLNINTRVAILDDITSMDLDTAYTFTFANGQTYTTSVMSYLKTLLSDSSVTDNVANLCSAMYWYNQAANAVFE